MELHMRPVSDLRNKFPEIEKLVKGGEAVCITKNGYGTMVLVSLEDYAGMQKVIDDVYDEYVDKKLREAEAPIHESEWLTHEEVYAKLDEQMKRATEDNDG